MIAFFIMHNQAFTFCEPQIIKYNHLIANLLIFGVKKNIGCALIQPGSICVPR